MYRMRGGNRQPALDNGPSPKPGVNIVVPKKGRHSIMNWPHEVIGRGHDQRGAGL
jgi:hypothetical protein